MNAIVYRLDGLRVQSRQDFFDLVGEAVCGPGTYFGNSLDGFDDCLSGGYGTPEDGAFEFVLASSEAAREALGYGETVRWRLAQRPHLHPNNLAWWDEQLELARHNRGQTVFDIIAEIFQRQGIPLILQ